MAKYNVDISYKLMIESNGKVRFSQEFQEQIQKAVLSVLKGKPGLATPKPVSSTSTEVVFLGGLEPPWKGDLKHHLDLLTEHGRDFDVLQTILDKYPALRDHPRVNELVGTFDMLSAKAQELLNDTKSKPSQATKPIAKPGPVKGLSKAELAEDREKKLLGAGSEQVEVGGTKHSLANLVTHPSFNPNASRQEDA